MMLSTSFSPSYGPNHLGGAWRRVRIGQGAVSDLEASVIATTNSSVSPCTDDGSWPIAGLRSQ